MNVNELTPEQRQERYDRHHKRKQSEIWKRNSRPVKVGEVCYKSISAAAAAMDCSATTIYNRIKYKEPFIGMTCEFLPKGTKVE